MENLEKQINAFDAAVRRDALAGLWDGAQRGAFELPELTHAVNLHCHTFYSFNGYGDSPSAVAWKARKAGLGAIGIVDFDVLDAVDEFLSACKLLGMRACAGIETRVFLKPFASRVINSPGEPGIAYHMGAGFTGAATQRAGWTESLKRTAQDRNKLVLDRVNTFLSEIRLDYDSDVLPLTPNGNATERHLCIAYYEKAQTVIPNAAKRLGYWSEKLGVHPDELIKLESNPPQLQGLIRGKLMKRGGVGYIKPDGTSFPPLEDVNRDIIDAGAIPAMAWLDGTSDGESDIDALLDYLLESGVEAVNIIPDRNWNISDGQDRTRKVANLHAFVERALALDLPILVGTECNAPGQRFVDEFNAPEMAPLVDPAFDAALILHAHTALADAGLGYSSGWAHGALPKRSERNAFYRRAGEVLAAGARPVLRHEMTPNEVLAAIG